MPQLVTVLVDQARWPWRGLRWAHLVSDTDTEELHGFAGRLGLRRLGFQGDHYDVTVAQRAVAVALGAEAVDSRVLVRRLRAAGLRRGAGAPSPRWRLCTELEIAASHQGAPALAALAAAVTDRRARRELNDVVGWFLPSHPRRIRVLRRGATVAVVVAGCRGRGELTPATAMSRFGPHLDGEAVVFECFIDA